MNSRTRLACGVAIGYLLGRTRKMRLALMVAGATGAAGTPRELVRRGLTRLAAVPEVGELTTMAKGQFVDAAKTAAMTAASSRIDALNQRLQGTSGDADPDADADGEEERPRSSADADHEENGGAERPRPRRRASGTTRRRASADDSGDTPRRSGTRRTTRTPVRRAGR